MSPTNSRTHRLRIRSREDVDDAAANREGAVLVDRVFTREAGVDEQLGQRPAARISVPDRISSDARSSRDPGALTPRQQRRGRGHDEPRGAAGRRMQRTGARRAATRKSGVIPR
jgi:hypothetical protein